MSKPAFPQSDGQSDGDHFTDFCAGMSLRDYFAGQALVSSRPPVWPTDPEETNEQRAKSCYAVADAMLAEREKGVNHGR